MPPLRGGRENILIRYLQGFQPRALGYFLCEQKVAKKSLKGASPPLRIPQITGIISLRPWHSLFCLPNCRPLRSPSASLFMCVSVDPTVQTGALPAMRPLQGVPL